MKPAGQMTLTLTPELERFVRAEVKRGAFASSSEYVRELVRKQYRISKADAAQALDEAIARGLEQSRTGLGSTVDATRRELMKEFGRSAHRRRK